VFAENGVSIETVRQQQRPGRDELADPLAADDARFADGARAALVVVTHTAPDAALAATVEALAGLPIVAAVESVMRVEGD
jgi:homoserine dehydrogenase